jgi:hypothetical protein
MCPIVPTLQCGLVRSNFSFAIFYLLGFQLRRNQIVSIGFLVRANQFLLVHHFLGNPPAELGKIFRKTLGGKFQNRDANSRTPEPGTAHGQPIRTSLL